VLQQTVFIIFWTFGYMCLSHISWEYTLEPNCCVVGFPDSQHYSTISTYLPQLFLSFGCFTLYFFPWL
jgi:hypothetical protein